MPSEEELIDPSKKDEFVPAVFARSQQEAELYRQLLEDHDIDAVIGYEETEETNDAEGKMTHGMPVLVLESFLDEASEIIADREDLDEFDTDDEFDEDEDEDEFKNYGPVLDGDEDDEDEDDGAAYKLLGGEDDNDEDEDDEDDSSEKNFDLGEILKLGFGADDLDDMDLDEYDDEDEMDEED